MSDEKKETKVVKKMKYEMPKLVKLNGNTKGEGLCDNGSGDEFCDDGSAATIYCDTGQVGESPPQA